MPLLEARDLFVRFEMKRQTVFAVNGVDLDLNAGEVLCILGESGSGKSVLLRELMRLNPPRITHAQGSIRIDGHDIVAIGERAREDIRGKLVSMIFQDAMTAFDPIYTIGAQIEEAILRHEPITHAAARQCAIELLEMVQIPSAKWRHSAYPHELSGGLRQRAMIAMALSCKPRLLLADEPTTALDATVQIQVLFLLRQLQHELGMGVIFVTHDIGVACEIADRVAVMYAGRFVEEAPVIDIMDGARHPYSRGLMAATVDSSQRGQKLMTIPGAPPRLTDLDVGCAFSPRCGYAEARCLTAMPPFVGADAHRVRCVRA